LLQRLVEEAVRVEVVLHQADALDAPGDADRDLAAGDTSGDDRCGAEAGAAVSIDRHARNRPAHPCREPRGAGDVVPPRPPAPAGRPHPRTTSSTSVASMRAPSTACRNTWAAMGMPWVRLSAPRPALAMAVRQ